MSKPWNKIAKTAKSLKEIMVKDEYKLNRSFGARLPIFKGETMSKEKKSKGGRGSALKIPLRCSSELREVSGEKRLSRGGAIAWFWKYADKHKLKDKEDGRIIHVEKDKKLAAVMGKKPIRMTEVAGKIFKHLRKEE